MSSSAVCKVPMLWLCALSICQGVCLLNAVELGSFIISFLDRLIVVIVLFLGCVLGCLNPVIVPVCSSPFMFLKASVGILPFCLPTFGSLQFTEVSQLQGYGLAKLPVLGSSTVLTSVFVLKLTFLLSFSFLLL